MSNMERYRYRIRFEKSESIRFISHLDLHRTWERTLRRAALPVYHSQGFNPRPKINLSRALPLGQTSECELMDVWLEQEIPIKELRRRIEDAVPPGLIVSGVERIPLSEPSIQSRISSATYRVLLPKDIGLDAVQREIERLRTSKRIDRVRRDKSYDLRPLIESLSIIPGDGGGVTLEMQLAAREGATGRPEEVLLAMSLDHERARIHRIGLLFADDPIDNKSAA